MRNSIPMRGHRQTIADPAKSHSTPAVRALPRTYTIERRRIAPHEMISPTFITPPSRYCVCKYDKKTGTFDSDYTAWEYASASNNEWVLLCGGPSSRHYPLESNAPQNNRHIYINDLHAFFAGCIQFICNTYLFIYIYIIWWISKYWITGCKSKIKPGESARRNHPVACAGQNWSTNDGARKKKKV